MAIGAFRMILPVRSRAGRVLVAALTALILISSVAEARRGGFGFGSRGSRTYQAPPPTQTAPKPAAPIERSTTPQQQPSVAQDARPGSARQDVPGGFFSTRGGFLGGLVGAGLIGMLLGYGFFGGLGGLASILGLLLQVGLVVLLVSLAIRLFQNRKEPAYATAGAQSLQRERSYIPATPGGSGGITGTGPATDVRRSIDITNADYDAFEHALHEVQRAYAREDVEALRAYATPEVASHLAQELAANASRGIVNHVRDVRLLQGDLAEAWQEDGIEYATVAMRYEAVDYMAERGTGLVVDGDAERATETTEIWTFLRVPRGRWLLSAIQPV